MAKIRTFIAIDLTQGIRQSAAKLIAPLRNAPSDYNWVEPDNLHITLNFLGDVPEVEVPDVCRLVAGAVKNFGSFEISVCGLGCFPTAAKPRVVWMGIDDGAPELTALQEKLSVALETMRFPRDRNTFRPHVTLGRIQRGGRYCGRIAEFVAQHQGRRVGTMTVDQILIYSSFLDRRGPTCSIMSRVALT